MTLSPVEARGVLLADLNEEQQSAVGSDSRRLLVGAGSGKTEVMARRVAWWIAVDEVSRDEIVAFTFTEAAAEELKFRIRTWLEQISEEDEDPTLSGMYVGTMPIRLSPTTTTFRVLPIARVKLGVSGSGDIASNSEQGPEGVERVERQSRARVSRYERNTTAHDRKNHASATALQLRRGPRQPATLPVKLSM